MVAVHVSNIAPATSDTEIKEFFSFCGKIAHLAVNPDGETKTADVTFEKDTAAKTALLLNNTQLGGNQISVTIVGHDSDAAGDDFGHVKENAERDTDELTQEEKPRARILAEYLAHGYVVGDAAIQSALELDQKHNVSNRFLNTLQNLDSKYHASDRARATDESYGITQRFNNFFAGIGTFFEKATENPTGKKVAQFYTEGQRQVQEVHAEARRLADLKKTEHGGSAYKAAGLEKVFGKEKDKEAGAATDSAAPATTSSEPAPAAAAPAPTDEKSSERYA